MFHPCQEISMTLLRHDAVVTLYVLRHKSTDGTWVDSSLDHFKFADSKRASGSGEPTSGVKHHFEAGGECWKRYGIHGVLELDIGLEGLREIATANPEFEFRLDAVRISQATSTVATIGPLQPFVPSRAKPVRGGAFLSGCGGSFV
jgi:hypothetical protein